MILGVDFDNTIVGYDALFHRVAREWGCIPEDLPANKSEVRNHLRRIGQEHVWTRLQGVVYGARMAEAEPYPGVRDFFLGCRRRGVPVFIISHKTRHPFLGEQYDLHAAALSWLDRQGFLAENQLGLPRERVFFELTKPAKLARIAACGCTDFVDDLPEFLAEPEFPAGIRRLLFDPNRLYSEDSRFERVTSWEEAASALWANDGPAPPHVAPDDTRAGPSAPIEVRASATPHLAHSTDLAELRRAAEPFLTSHGMGPDFSLTPIPGGANNRVLLVEDGTIRRVLKAYFHDDRDPRDRFRAEQGLYRVAWECGLRCVPEPFGWDKEQRLGLFSYVEGRKLRADEVTGQHVREALEFVEGLNAARGMAATAELPAASEACFSLGEHLELVARRLTRLGGMVVAADVDAEAISFLRNELEPAWESVRRGIEAYGPRNLETTLPFERRCLSPSDFGFHNALLAADGRLRFFDFEYAGWDDPTKLVCDFFCQPQTPVGRQHWDGFIEALDRSLGWQGALATRAAALLPAYQIKWCCILLNEFVKTDQARRVFAQPETDPLERKAAQLAKARHMLERLPFQVGCAVPGGGP